MILITGGAGYIGSICALKLLEKGFDVVVFDNLSASNSYAIEYLSEYKNFKFVKGDLLKLKDLRKLFKEYKIDICFHLAACSSITEFVKNPQKNYAQNIYGTMNLLYSMIENDVKKFIFSSSASVYGNISTVPIKEEGNFKPINPYGKTKYITEEIIKDFSKIYGLEYVILRIFNVAGANTKSKLGEINNSEVHLISNIMKSILENKKIYIYGDNFKTKDGTCIRDYVDIEDLANAGVLAVKYLENGGKKDIFNIGTGKGYSVKEIIEYCEKITAQKIDFEVVSKREEDPDVLVADNTKAKEVLGWIPEKEVETSIRTAYEFEKFLLLDKH